MNKKLFNKYTIISALVLIFIGGFFVFKNGSKNTGVQYVTATAATGDITQSVAASGSVIAEKQENANFSTSGKLSEIDVQVGDSVKQNQTLAKLDTTQLQTQVNLAKISLDEAKNNLGSKKQTSTPSPYTISNLEEAINQAQLKVNTDQNNLNATMLISPKSGVISALNNAVGDSVQTTTTVITITDIGGANPQNLMFSIPGKISEVDASVNETVSSGQTLMKLDSTSEQIQLETDQSQLNIAKNNLQQAYIANTPTSYDLNNLQDAINAAAQNLITAETNLNNATLMSSMSGLVANINATVGDNVSGTGSTAASATNSSSTSTSQGVVVIIDPSSLAVDLQIPESDIAKVQVGQNVQLAFTALQNKTYVGSVQTISSTSTTVSNIVYYDVKVSIDKLDGLVKPGMSADATIVTQTKSNVITIPSSAIKTVNSQQVVQILKNNIPETVVVTTGISDDTNTEIINGINAGDVVITSTISASSTPITGTTNGTGGGGVRFGGGGAAAARSFGL